MNEEQVKAKLEQMKKTRKALTVVSTLVALVCIAILVVYNFVGVTFLKSELPGQVVSAADFSKGFAFPGWQVVYWGCGGQFIMQDNLFNPNPLTIIGTVGTILVLVVLTALYKKGKNKEKAIKEFIMAAFLVYSALVLGALIVPVSISAATSGGVYDFKNKYLLSATSSYTATAFATLTCVVLFAAAAIKIAIGAVLLKQRSFAQKNAPKKENA
jgi:hypothetical protein